ncbi:extracellular calcium-sensing receptor-like [Austrofundulus limnaeus]|uniref:Extracellular calcium-sensing receptor-like n=1 Tax=Austrofundulus limnaeus TaxID=52670 RepID=A0A2I4BKH9_AUSLI|nr:PREDICTED: extracellular calcium-sensing receptor-like [Austrofundulus limnaeus]
MRSLEGTSKPAKCTAPKEGGPLRKKSRKSSKGSEGLSGQVAHLTSELESIKTLLEALRGDDGIALVTDPVPEESLGSRNPAFEEEDAISLTASATHFHEQLDSGSCISNPSSHTTSGSHSEEDGSIVGTLRTALARLHLDALQSQPTTSSAFFQCPTPRTSFMVPPSAEYVKEVHACWADTKALTWPTSDGRTLAAMQDAPRFFLGHMPSVEPAVASLIVAPDEVLRTNARCPCPQCHVTDDLLCRDYDSGSQNGYSIQFCRCPPIPGRVRITVIHDQVKALALRTEIDFLLAKGAIVPVNPLLDVGAGGARIPVVQNGLANFLSRERPPPGEWRLHPEVVEDNWQSPNTPEGPSGGTLGSPSCTLLAPEDLVSTAAQSLLQLSNASPPRKDLLSQLGGRLMHPNPRYLRLWVWPLQGPVLPFRAMMGSTEDSSVKCTLQGTARLPAFAMEGDFVIGGVFSMHYKMHTVIYDYTTKPEALRCTGSVNNQNLRFCRTMIFAIEEINNSTELLPGIKLGYQIFDSCSSGPGAVDAAFQLSNGEEPMFYEGNNCSQSGVVMAVVGDSGSSQSIGISHIIGPFNISEVSHSATCACLSDKKQYPTFFRTIPSDQFQVDTLVKMVKYFGWTWIGTVHSDTDYGNYGMASFLPAAKEEGICVEYSESFYRTDPRSKIQRVADVIRRSTALVIVAFLASGEMKALLEELALDPPPPRQWIGSEGWIAEKLFMSYGFCAGAIGVAIQKSVIPGLRDFLLDLSPSEVAASSMLTKFWEEAFNCTLTASKGLLHYKRVCDGNEDITTLINPYTDTSQLRVSNMVYKAVYAVAYAIHNAMCEENNLIIQCDRKIKLKPKQIFSALKKVNFSRNGYHVSFDANGDPVAFYELVNWQKSESAVTELVTVGYYDASLPKGQEFQINRNISWVEGVTQVPVSVCSESCPPGSRKVLQKGKPICCYDCIPCPEGEISNMTDSPDCFQCPAEYWPNAERDACLPKPVEFLSFDEVLAIILAAFSIFGACLAIITAAIFFCHRTTPIVKANNSELSFLLLFSLTLCFLCSLTFIGAPSEWSCVLRHTTFGIIFVLCISCVLGKTIVVLMAFKATLPGSNAMKWFGPPQQRMTVVFLTFFQVLICTVWLVLSPPFPMKNLSTYKEKIILECALGSAVGFWAVLGYIGLLAVFCFVLAVLARKLPDNFNEAKLITFSMLIFCAVWITFIPAYVSSPGKFTVAVEIFAILASSFGLILCIFAPKCFIILFQPEKNCKKYLMNKM